MKVIEIICRKCKKPYLVSKYGWDKGRIYTCHNCKGQEFDKK